jgi:Na+-driven multidrug efflux pump
MAVAALVGVTLPMVVIALMGRMSDAALYVRSLYVPLSLLFVALHTAVEISNMTLAAIRRGQDRLRDVLPIAVTTARFATAAGGLLCLVLFAGAPVLAGLLDVEPAAVGDFVWFVRWTALANLLMIVPLLSASSLRGVGHARAATAITLTTAAIEIGGIALFGLAAGYGMFTVPVSIAAAGVAGSVLGLVLLRRHGIWYPRDRDTHWSDVAGHLRQVGLPVALSFAIMFLLGVIQLIMLGRFGPEVVAGFTTATTIQTIVIEPAIALGSATGIVMNQLRGARQATRLSGALRAGLEIAATAYVAAAALLWLTSDHLGLLVTSNPQIAGETASYLRTVAPTLVIMGLLMLAVTVLEQTGGGLVALGLNLLYLVGVVTLGAVGLAMYDDPVWLYRAIAVMNLGGLVVVIAAIRYVRRIGTIGTFLANRAANLS